MKRSWILAVFLGSAMVSAQTATHTGTVLNSIEISDNYPGADIGAKINAAVADCESRGLVSCLIQVNQSGTISTPPVLPLGFAVSFNPAGTFTLATHWAINHRSISVFGNGAHFNYSLADGGRAIYVGKGILSTVNIVNGTLSDCGTGHSQIERVSGATFGTIDPGDQAMWNGGDAGNIARLIDSQHLCLTASVTPASGVSMVVFITDSISQGSYPSSGVTIRDLTITDGSTAADAALTLDLVETARIDHFTAANFLGGTCLNLFGAISNNITALGCYSDGNGLHLDQTPLVSSRTITLPANTNRIYGADLLSSSLASGFAVLNNYGSGNKFTGLRLEGNANTMVLSENSTSGGGNLYDFADYERNGIASGSNASTVEIHIASSNNTLQGPAQIQSYNPSQLVVFMNPSSGNTLLNLQFNASGRGAYAYRFQRGATGRVVNAAVLAGLTIPPPGGIEDISNNYTVNELTTLTGAVIGTGTLLSGNQGNGALVQHSTGTLTPGNLLKTDANSNDVDAGIASANLVTKSSTPTIGKAACWKTAAIIGYCSTVPDAKGSCTCN